MKDEVINYIITIAGDIATVEKVMLFGSRARGDGNDKSDYDIAVFGTFTQKDKTVIEYGIKYEAPTLKKIDLVFFNDCKNEELKKNILKDGIILYDKNGN